MYMGYIFYFIEEDYSIRQIAIIESQTNSGKRRGVLCLVLKMEYPITILLNDRSQSAVNCKLFVCILNTFYILLLKGV